jgi:PKD repeat protein
MKTFFLILCVLLLNAPVSLPGQTINRYEYFFDTDPGVGNGIGVSVTAADSVSVNIALNIAALTPGFHKAGIRFRNTAGVWSHAEVRSFFIQTLPLQNRKITTAEYFIGNTDPGIGLAHPVTITNPADSVTIIEDTILNNLPLGTYKINIRFKDEQGVWSHLETRTFTVCATYGAQSEFSYQVEGNRIFFTNQSLYNDTSIWKFGDNTTASVANPIKTYAAAGSYNVQLITGNVCGYDTLSNVIQIRGLQRVEGAKAGNYGVSTFMFEGVGFTTSTPVQLRQGNTVLTPLSKLWLNSNRVKAVFNLTGIPTGMYDAVAVTDGAFDTLKNAVEIISGTASNDLRLDFSSGRRLTRPGRAVTEAGIINNGGTDAVMVPFLTLMNAVPSTDNVNTNLFLETDMVFLQNKGVFQHTYQYLSNKGVPPEVMFANNLDTARKKHMVAYYKVRVPAYSSVRERVRQTEQRGTAYSYQVAAAILGPVFDSYVLIDSVNTDYKACYSAFLKQAVEKQLNLKVNSNWNTCFSTAFDTLMRTMAAIAKDPINDAFAIPMQAGFSALLAKVADCGSTGIPTNLSGLQFKRIIQHVMNNWIYLEEVDSLDTDCIDTTSRISGRMTRTNNVPGRVSQINEGGNCSDCPGAQVFPEMCDQCLPILQAGKIGGELEINGHAWSANSAVVGCQEWCETTSVDPNAKYGPGNNNDRKYINHLKQITYKIDFENLPTATAPAAYVEIKDTLDKTKFDLNSIALGVFAWGDSVIMAEPNRKNSSILTNLKPAHPNFLRIDAFTDTTKGIITWKFWTLDTVTLQLTDNPAEGFLPPNTNGVNGAGYVTFTIAPKAGITNGSSFTNKASIIFDNNAPIITDVWEHRIDTLAPVSSVNNLPPVTTTNTFTVSWSGTDANAGIDRYHVYISVNDSTYKLWKRFTTETSSSFTGEFGKTYKFFSVALDKAGNFENNPANPFLHPDAFTKVETATSVTELNRNGIRIYPTVTKDFVRIQATGKKLQAELLTITGQRLQTIFINQQAQLHMADLPNGIYLLRLLPLNTTIKIMKY